eukprot:3419271-Rhodomonas_salina.3
MVEGRGAGVRDVEGEGGGGAREGGRIQAETDRARGERARRACATATRSAALRQAVWCWSGGARRTARGVGGGRESAATGLLLVRFPPQVRACPVADVACGSRQLEDECEQLKASLKVMSPLEAACLCLLRDVGC